MTEKLVWKQNVAGIIEVTLSTNICGMGCHEIKMSNSANTKQPFLVVFNVKGEIVLDDVLDYLPYTISGKALRNVNHDSTANSIKLMRASIGNVVYNAKQIQDINTQKSDSSYMINNVLRLCFMVLKTVCDKTVVQRIKNPKEMVDAICTIDSHVFAVPLLEYLSGNTRYCPSVLISKEYGYDQFSFQDVGNNNELLNRIIYFLSFAQSSLFKGDINAIKKVPILANGLNDPIIGEMADKINKLLSFTDKYIENAKKKFAIFSCDNLWEYIKNVAIAESYDELTRKKQTITAKITTVLTLLANYNGSNEDMKTQLMNAFLDIPLLIPSITDLIIELENQADDFVPISIDEMESYIYDKLYDKLLIRNLEKTGMNGDDVKRFWITI